MQGTVNKFLLFQMDHRTFHMNVVDIQRFEEKLREAERRLGVKDGVPVTYERGGDTAGKLLMSLVIVAVLVSLLSRSKSMKPPISMDTFVSILLFSTIYAVGFHWFKLVQDNRCMVPKNM